MTLRPDDKALAAYLIEHEIVSMRDLVAALEDAGASARDLGESLVQVGALEALAVLGLRAEVAKRMHWEKNVDRTHRDLSPEAREQRARAERLLAVDADTSTDLAYDHDTIFDMPAQSAPSGPTNGSEGTGGERLRRAHELARELSSREDPGSGGISGEVETDPTHPAPHAPEPPDAFSDPVPTRPYGPGYERFDSGDIAGSDLLASVTLRPSSHEDENLEPSVSDPTVPPPATRGVTPGRFGEDVPDPFEPDQTPGFSPSWPSHENVLSATVHSDRARLSSRAKPISEESTRGVNFRTSEGIEMVISRDHERLAPSGKRVEERYQMLGEIGRGGMGRILKARDTEIGREVAVKILLGGRDAPENMIRRFWMEVQATGQLEHPSIIPIHDVGRLPSGELFYVMKKLSGRTLQDIIQLLKNGDAAAELEFTRARLLTLFQQIAYAVAFAHARGVIHRDIKPANIMVGAYGEAMLLDWGLAKIVDQVDIEGAEEQPRVVTASRFTASGTATGTITGTPQYMSPEATEGQPELINTKSDVYGLGAVLYEILTLDPPFPDIGFVPTVVKVRKGDYKPPRDLAPDRNISPELEDLCLQAMAKDPDQRPIAKKLADDIGRILEGAKERERRVLEAKARIREGRKSTERWKALKVELQSAESEAKRLAKEVPPWASVDKKQPMWALEDRVSELKIEAISAFEESEAAFLRALGEVPDDREARSALAALYFARFGEAERARDVEAQRYYRNLVARYDDGVWARVMAGDGTLEINASPGDVEVTIARMELVGRMLRPGEPTKLGAVPIPMFDIPIGSYLLTFRRDGEREIYRPVLIGRTERVNVSMRFRSALEIGDAFVLIPEGPAILGGDSIAHGGLDRRVAEIREFAIARLPVTCEEYLAFINSIARESVDRALRHVPRARAQEGHYWRYNKAEGRFEYPEKSPGGHSWVGNLPVSAVSMLDAQAYIEWRSRITGERLRLPHENEWEKAARGVDGRFFPWGDHFDPTFCKMKESRDRAYPEPEPVGAFPTDRSPYGVRDMAGGVREICMTDEGGGVRPVMRGGCWSDTGLFCRVAFRHVMQPDFVNTGLGFRLVKDLG